MSVQSINPGSRGTDVWRLSWFVVLGACAVAALSLWLFWDGLSYMWGSWMDTPEYSHAILIPPDCGLPDLAAEGPSRTHSLFRQLVGCPHRIARRRTSGARAACDHLHSGAVRIPRDSRRLGAVLHRQARIPIAGGAAAHSRVHDSPAVFPSQQPVDQAAAHVLRVGRLVHASVRYQRLCRGQRDRPGRLQIASGRGVQRPALSVPADDSGIPGGLFLQRSRVEAHSCCSYPASRSHWS